MSQRSKTPTPLVLPELSRKTLSRHAQRALQSWTALALMAGALHAGTPTTLTTMFASNNGSTGNMFDIEASNTVQLKDLDCNFSPGTVDYEIYTTPGTYIGKEATPTEWTLVASGTVVSNGMDVPTPLLANLNITIHSTESLGVYVAVSNNGVLKYTNGLGSGIAASNADMTIAEGIGISYPFGGTFTPRVWNGTIHYVPDTGSTYCFGDGGTSSCPCGNLAGPQRGCHNSTGIGARLIGSGSSSLAHNNLRLKLDGMPAGRVGLLIAGKGDVNGGMGAYFGDGLSCVSGKLVAFGTRASDASGNNGWAPNLQGQADFVAGSTHYFQVVYRDMHYPCGSGFNTSNGIALTVQP